MQTSFHYTSEVAALRETLRQRILHLLTSDSAPADFGPLALDIFRYQATYNAVYRTFINYLNIRPDSVPDLQHVPFLPISFFKNHTVRTGTAPATLTFASSGTTGSQTSRHLVADPDLYDQVSRQLFEQQYGPLNQFHILALLPSYLERNNSSLVYMVQRFMQATGSDQSGFFLNDLDALTSRLQYLIEHPDGRNILLVGVTFGLLDWAESGRDLAFLGRHPNLVIMETGGMKGRRQELLREEVHEILTQRLGMPAIHSEYGMTELLSQAYSTGQGVFRTSATLRIFLRDINDPFHLYRAGQTSERRTGGINVVDLANLDSCAFIETQDLGQYAGPETKAPDNPEAYFRVIGRFDNSDIRGCNLMVV
ncbi:acyltransferase [Nibrella saemangeumensis]|uniref:Acyltransferase n=1 Tax=Nibrella saemangeumensis TaxID=1084526 RepID=A0ABP8MDJ3_9BACT